MSRYDRAFPEGVSYSYGGGVQSTAMLVLAAQGHLPVGPFLFSNVGDDSEHPATLRYVREVAFDYAAAHGIPIHELHRVPRKGAGKGVPETLWGRLMRPGSRSLPIPVRMPDTGAPGTRSCTADFKIRVVGRWVQEHGATEARPVRVGIGISTDEYQRAKDRRADQPWEEPWYPLLTIEHRLGPRGLSRDACAQIIRDAGLPVPPKSSCFFCPFHKPTVWADMARDEPDLFERAAFLEDTLNGRRSQLACPGAGKLPLEHVQVEALPADVDPLLYTPEELTLDGAAVQVFADYDPPDGRGACPSCRSRQPVETAGPGPLSGRSVWRMAPHQRGPVYLTRFGKPLRSVFGGAQQLSLLAPGWDEDEGYRCGDVCDT